MKKRTKIYFNALLFYGYFFKFTAIIPAIPPIIVPNIMSLNNVLEISKLNPSSIENTKNDVTVNNNPIIKPEINPSSPDFFIPKYTPIIIDAPLIICTIIVSVVSLIAKNLSINANTKININDAQTAYNAPLIMVTKKLFFACNSSILPPI